MFEIFNYEYKENTTILMRKRWPYFETIVFPKGRITLWSQILFIKVIKNLEKNGTLIEMRKCVNMIYIWIGESLNNKLYVL
jgi:hypothetical protein